MEPLVRFETHDLFMMRQTGSVGSRSSGSLRLILEMPDDGGGEAGNVMFCGLEGGLGA